MQIYLRLWIIRAWFGYYRLVLNVHIQAIVRDNAFSFRGNDQKGSIANVL